MKKTVNINLAGQPFTIDEDAYRTLEKYLSDIKNYFEGNNGEETIIYDIEARIAELFEDQMQGGTSIISMSHVNKIQQIMGMPKEFTSTDDAENSSTSHRTGKRLFRDPEDKMIGGVASGLTAYFGLHSPNIIRALFILIAFTFVGFIPYILLWIFVPEAKTASDRLAMKGEEINIDSIAKYADESLEEIKETLNDLGENIKKKMS